MIEAQTLVRMRSGVLAGTTFLRKGMVAVVTAPNCDCDHFRLCSVQVSLPTSTLCQLRTTRRSATHNSLERTRTAATSLTEATDTSTAEMGRGRRRGMRAGDAIIEQMHLSQLCGRTSTVAPNALLRCKRCRSYSCRFMAQ